MALTKVEMDELEALTSKALSHDGLTDEEEQRANELGKELRASLPREFLELLERLADSGPVEDEEADA